MVVCDRVWSDVGFEMLISDAHMSTFHYINGASLDRLKLLLLQFIVFSKKGIKWILAFAVCGIFFLFYYMSSPEHM